MMLYIVTEEPYHDNSTIVGVFLLFDHAKRFVEAAPSRPLVDDWTDGWGIEEWDIDAQKSGSYWCMHSPGIGNDGPLVDRDWVLQIMRFPDA